MLTRSDPTRLDPRVHPTRGQLCDNKLSFGDHIGNVVSKAYQRIYLIFRSFVSKKFQLQKQVFQNNTLNNSFANRAIDCWNNLPSEIAEAVNYMTFNKLLNQVDSPFF